MRISKLAVKCLNAALILTVLLTPVATGHAAVPKLLTYQGVLKDSSGNFLTGTYSIAFRLYSASTGGTALWTETQSSVSASSGKFSVQLGSVTAITLDFNADYWLSIQVGSDAEMSPRLRLTSMGYGIRSDYENNGFTQSAHDAMTHKTIEGVKDNTVNIGKTNFKLDAYTAATANSMGDMIVDTLNDSTGINSGASSNYTYRGTPNYDVTLTPTGGGIAQQNTSEDAVIELLNTTNYPSQRNGFGQQFQHGSAVTVDKVVFKCSRIGSLSGNFKVRLYTSSSGLPGTQLAESSNIAATSFPDYYSGGDAEVTVTFPATSLSASTTYIIVLENIDAVGDASNFIRIKRTSSSTYSSGEAVGKSSTGTWSVATSNDTYFKLYEQVAYSGSATVISNAYSEPVAPTEAMVIADETLGTGSITYYVSRDNGTTWTQCTKETVTSISAQPSGTQVKWKAVITGNAELNAIAIAV